MHGEHPLRVRVAAGLIGAMFLAASSALLVNYGLGAFDGGYRLTATFDQSAQGLDGHSDVKIRGVTVGTVNEIRLRPDGRADVTFEMKHGARVPYTALASIEPLSVFGPKFVNLQPGSAETSGPYLAAGDRITQTTPPIDLSTVLTETDNLLTKVDPEDVATVFSTFAESVAGLGPQMRRIIDNSATLVDIGARHLPEVQQFLHDLAVISGSLADDAGAIATTIVNGDATALAISTRVDRDGALLDDASRVAGSLAGYIQMHRDSVRTFIDSAAVVLRVLYDRVPQFPDVFRLIDEFFGNLGGAMRLPGPGGELIAALHGGVLESLCANFALPVPCTVVSP